MGLSWCASGLYTVAAVTLCGTLTASLLYTYNLVTDSDLDQYARMQVEHYCASSSLFLLMDHKAWQVAKTYSVGKLFGSLSIWVGESKLHSHTHTLAHTHTYTCTHTHIHTHNIHTRTHVHTHTAYTHTYIIIHMRTHARTHTYTHTHTQYTHTQYTHIHTRTQHTHIHTCTYPHTHTAYNTHTHTHRGPWWWDIYYYGAASCRVRMLHEALEGPGLVSMPGLAMNR